MEGSTRNNQKIFRMQPILCPWITSQPYHSSLWNKNRGPNKSDPRLSGRYLNNPWINRQMPLGIPRSQEKSMSSIQQSSSQFFYFLRLMQLFPDTHPATLHTVLALCKNDFFCAVDKMLYAKRCKLLCYKKNILQKNNNKTNQKMKNDDDNGRKTAPFSHFLPESKNKVLEAPSIIINTFNNTEKPEDLSTIKPPHQDENQ